MLFSVLGLFLEDALFTVSLQNLIISEFRNPKSFAVRLYVDVSMNGLQIPRSQNHKNISLPPWFSFMNQTTVHAYSTTEKLIK